jgi:hypothetical protein
LENKLEVVAGKFEVTTFGLRERSYLSIFAEKRRHDDRCTAYIATSSGPESGLNFSLRGAMSATICVEHLQNFAKRRRLGWSARAAAAAGEADNGCSRRGT